MGDFDYGRENGLWGDDGIPYWINERPSYSYRRSSTKVASKSKAYNYSEQLAYNNGYRAQYDENAYNGRYFVKDGKIWIHNIEALKKTLRVRSEYELKK